MDYSKLAEKAWKQARAGLKEADKLTRTSDWDGARKQMLYAHAALQFCEGGKAEMDVEKLALEALQAKLPEPERSKLAALVKDGSASQPIWTTVGHTTPRADRLEWKKVLAALPSVAERERDGALDDRILRGCEVSEGKLEQPKRVVRFLVSSTFTVSSPCVYACALRVGLPSVRPDWALLTARLRAGMSSVGAFLPPAARMRISRLTPYPTPLRAGHRRREEPFPGRRDAGFAGARAQAEARGAAAPPTHTPRRGWLSPCRSRIPGCAGEFWSSPPEQYLVRHLSG